MTHMILEIERSRETKERGIPDSVVVKHNQLNSDRKVLKIYLFSCKFNYYMYHSRPNLADEKLIFFSS